MRKVISVAGTPWEWVSRRVIGGWSNRATTAMSAGRRRISGSSWCLAVLAVVLGGLVPASVWAQNAELSGIIRDPQGAIVVQAEVKLVDEATSVAVTRRSNGSGAY